MITGDRRRTNVIRHTFLLSTNFDNDKNANNARLGQGTRTMRDNDDESEVR
jgi:hypothetical protein